MYSLPCFQDLLDETAFNHYCLLVKSAYTLRKEGIPEQELNDCFKDIKIFVKDFQNFYGEEKMTYNTHILLHSVESVKKTGPLSFNSAYCFESNIHTLKSYVKGSKGMDLQIIRKHLQTLTFKTGSMKNLIDSEKAAHYCKTLSEHKKSKSLFQKVSEDLTVFGAPTEVNDDRLGLCFSYRKFIYKNCVHHSVEYSRVHKTDDTAVELINGTYARIQKILIVNNECFLKLSQSKIVSGNVFNGIEHIKKILSEDTVNLVYLPVHNIKCKVVLVNVRNGRYLAKRPNKVDVL